MIFVTNRAPYISVDFHGNCVLQIHSRKVPAASGLQRIAGRAISVKLHPQEVLAANLARNTHVRSEVKSTVWPYPKCGSDRLPYIQQLAYCEAEEVGPNVTNK